MSLDLIFRPPKRARYSRNVSQDRLSAILRPLQGKVQMNHMIELQQSGDVFIIVEDYSLLVSSERLCAVSAVFAAMLNGCFKEGSKIVMGDQSVHQVLLPDDDIDSVLLLCKVMCKRNDLIEGVPDAKSLLRLAVLCDKYQCITTLQTEVKSLVIRSRKRYYKNDTRSFCTLLCVAFIMDCGSEFQAISGLILDRFRERAAKEKRRLSYYRVLNHSLIKINLAAAFESKYKDIDQQIARMISEPFRKLRLCSCGGHRNSRAKRAGSFMEQLFKAELMPTDIQEVSISKIRKRVKSLVKVPCHHFKYCKAPSQSLIGMLEEELKKIEAMGTGLCLDCVKSNNRSALSGRCRTPHTTTA